MRIIGVLAILALAGCVEVSSPTPAPQSTATNVSGFNENTLKRVASDVMPVAINACNAQTRNLNCNFIIGFDENPKNPPNAFQTVAKDGRPLLVFNIALLQDLRNTDELAFIMGHEAAHHIKGHLEDTNRNATAGALLGSVLASVLGADAAMAETATRAGAMVGGRAYSKEFELEADSLGAVITERAGYNAVRGAAYFTRIPDPGNTFLGSHPPNAQRVETIRQSVAAM